MRWLVDQLELNKIIYLSKILSKFNTPSEYTEEKIDNLGRKIINNKYLPNHGIPNALIHLLAPYKIHLY